MNQKKQESEPYQGSEGILYIVVESPQHPLEQSGRPHEPCELPTLVVGAALLWASPSSTTMSAFSGLYSSGWGMMGSPLPPGVGR